MLFLNFLGFDSFLLDGAFLLLHNAGQLILDQSHGGRSDGFGLFRLFGVEPRFLEAW